MLYWFIITFPSLASNPCTRCIYRHIPHTLFTEQPPCFLKTVYMYVFSQAHSSSPMRSSQAHSSSPMRRSRRKLSHEKRSRNCQVDVRVCSRLLRLFATNQTNYQEKNLCNLSGGTIYDKKQHGRMKRSPTSCIIASYHHHHSCMQYMSSYRRLTRHGTGSYRCQAHRRTHYICRTRYRVRLWWKYI